MNSLKKIEELYEYKSKSVMTEVIIYQPFESNKEINLNCKRKPLKVMNEKMS
jgi:hypothetical protein